MSNSRDKKIYQETKHTMTNWFNVHYKRIKQRQRAKFSKELDFNRWELEQWIIDNCYDKFTTLFKEWVKHNYESDYIPSIDRLDNSKGHTKDNVVPCCIECNTARSDNFTFEEMKVIGKSIRKIKKDRKLVYKETCKKDNNHD